jgi:hypothetical protein
VFSTNIDHRERKKQWQEGGEKEIKSGRVDCRKGEGRQKETIRGRRGEEMMGRKKEMNKSRKEREGDEWKKR